MPLFNMNQFNLQLLYQSETMANISRKARRPSEVVLAAVTEYLDHKKNINPRVKPSKFCRKYDITSQTFAKAVKRIQADKPSKYFTLSDTKCHELQDALQTKFESGEELSKEIVMKMAYGMNRDTGPKPSKSWCHNFIKKYRRVANWIASSKAKKESVIVTVSDIVPVSKQEISCLLYTPPSPRD